MMRITFAIIWIAFNTSAFGQDGISTINTNVLPAPVFTIDGGFYGQPISVELNTVEGAKIYYTTNGLTPTPKSNLYTKPITIDSTSALSAIAVNNSSLSSKVSFQSYFISQQHVFPVVSIITDHTDEITNTDPMKNNRNKNIVGVSYFDKDRKEVFRTLAEMKLTGRSTRNYPQKSFAIHFRKNLGIKYIDYQLFSEKPKQKYYSFKLRNSGNDWYYTYFKDAMMHRIICKNTSIDYQGYEPVILYVNGSYYGIINLREEVCSHYIETNHKIDNDDIDLIQFSSLPTKGDVKHWNHMIDFVKKSDMTLQSNYDTVLSWIDVENFIDYQIAEIFYANTDWPMSNIKYWRPANDSGKWRWIFYDADQAFSTNKRRVKGHHNTMSYAMGNNNCHLPHLNTTLLEATVMLRSLMLNSRFKEQFLSRLLDLLNTNFQPAALLDTISNMKNRLEAEMPNHINRWKSSGGIPSMEKWNEEVNKMVQFAKERNDTMLHFIATEFKLGEVHQLSIKIQGEGAVDFNSINDMRNQFQGNYFGDLPIKLTAVPDPGSRFVGWEGINEEEESVEVLLKKDLQIIAVFK